MNIRRMMLLLGWMGIPLLAAAAPPVDHPSVEDASRILGLSPQTGGPLPRQGRVLESFDSNNYTYILVGSQEGRLWLAAPRVDPLPVGASIRFSNGMMMKNFYSRLHKRTFEEILFVERVERETP